MNYLKTKIGVGGIITIAVVIILVLIFAFRNGKYELYTVEKGDFSQVVTVSGKVVPAQEIDLSFEASGQVQSVSVEIGDLVKAGDVLARLDTSEISSEIQESQSSFESAKAQLNELVSVEGDTQVENESEELLNVLKKSYVTANDIVFNKVDTFFEDPDSRFPDFDKSLSNYFLRQEINDKRRDLQSVLEDWSLYNNSITVSGISSLDSEYNITQLQKIEDLLSKISEGSVDFNETNTITQSQIDAYIASISSARTTVASLIVEINQANESLRGVLASIPVQEAELRNAQANLNKLNSRISNYVITAPFDGVVTAREIEVGETADSKGVAISMIGNAGLEIETYIPEVRVAGVDVEDRGVAKLDAFGDLHDFEVMISHVDPRETEKDGITTYRTLLDFLKPHEDIRPGMTAEIEIIKKEIKDVILIPAHLVMSDDEGKYVEVMNGDVERRSVTLGLVDGKGSVIVEEGLSVGDEIVISIE